MTDDPFSSEERINATTGVMTVLDALDSEEVQAAAVGVRRTANEYRAALIDAGVEPQAAALSVMGAALGSLLEDQDADTPLP